MANIVQRSTGLERVAAPKALIWTPQRLLMNFSDCRAATPRRRPSRANSLVSRTASLGSLAARLLRHGAGKGDGPGSLCAASGSSGRASPATRMHSASHAGMSLAASLPGNVVRTSEPRCWKSERHRIWRPAGKLLMHRMSNGSLGQMPARSAEGVTNTLSRAGLHRNRGPRTVACRIESRKHKHLSERRSSREKCWPSSSRISKPVALRASSSARPHGIHALPTTSRRFCVSARCKEAQRGAHACNRVGRSSKQ
mmetsp:Transcript_24781/g.50248  ORF Transcript_24781/g.50248 Transcript_24781/m.50248 type:complete len:255 (-) Transcript_24781:109-873(-)